MSSRRYEYIKYENGKVLGEEKYCSLGTSKVSQQHWPSPKMAFITFSLPKVDSWWRYLFWHCSYCFCMCDEQGRKSDRYFNLRPTLSNITDNK
jgi:Domain of unknown function (DUF4803)